MSHIGDAGITKDFVNKTKLRVFVETGCYEGNAIQWAIDMKFEEIWSCDLLEQYITLCRGKFPVLANNIIHDDSTGFLKKVLPNIYKRSLFWLDAHCPKHYIPEHEETTLTHFPLYHECALIKELKLDYQNDIIMCDDVRTIVGADNDSPLAKDRPLDAYSVSYFTYSTLIKIFEDTHKPTFPNPYRDLLLFKPKA